MYYRYMDKIEKACHLLAVVCNPNNHDEFLGHYSVMYYLKPLITVHHNPYNIKVLKLYICQPE